MFQDFMAGKLPQVPGERPTLNDWEIHLGSIYPEVHICNGVHIRSLRLFSCQEIYDGSLDLVFVG